MAVRKLKGSWWVDFQYRGVRVRRRSPLNTKGGAQELEIELRQFALRHGSPVSQEQASAPHDTDTTPSFAAFAEQWFTEYAITNNRPSEQRAKRNALRNHLIPFLGSKHLAEIDNRLAEQLKAALIGKRLCRKSINNYLSTLRTCLSSAVEWNLLPAVPRIKPFKVAPPPFRYLASHEVEALLSAVPPGIVRSMIVVALQTGMRYCELVALRWEDVDLATGQLRVCRSEVRGHVGTTKSGLVRYIPISEQVHAVFGSLAKDAELVFHRNGRSVRYVRALETLHEACSLAGIQPMSWHTLRHTFASALVQRGVSLAVIRDLLGHTTVKMTERYAHLNDTPRRDAIALLGRDVQHVSTYRQPVSTLPVMAICPTELHPSILGSTKQKAPSRDDAPCVVGVDGVETDKGS